MATGCWLLSEGKKSTPTCSAKHLPGFVEHFDAFTARGITVACMAVNDAFVMDAWAKSQSVPEGLLMLGMSALLDEAGARALEDHGFDGFLKKPFTDEELLARVGELFELPNAKLNRPKLPRY